MNQLLEVGQTLQSKSTGMLCTIDAFIGGGGQGEVYKVLINEQPLALKWFFPHYLVQDKRLEARIIRAIQTGAPSDRFLWPLEVFRLPGVKGFGYLMPLRDDRFKGMTELVTRRIEPSLRTLTTTGFELAHSYLQLHAAGLCYRDISFGNVFFDPSNGEVRICDNDNVDIDGQPGTIGGTARFMAPEIVRGEATPGTHTDLYSLATLLFYLLINHHPLEGKREAAIRCFDLPAMTRLYGTDPLFIFDPDDDSNRPVTGYHDNALALWPIYPTSLHDLFTRAFTEGIRDPEHGRVRESEWRSLMIRLRDTIFYCTHCSAENFYDPQQITRTAAQGGTAGRCWSCRRALNLPPRMRIVSPNQSSVQSVIMLNFDTKIYPHHVNPRAQYDFSQPVAQIAQHPQNPDIWGLRNVGQDKWVATLEDGDVRDVEPGRSVTLSNGLMLHFGATEGTIRIM